MNCTLSNQVNHHYTTNTPTSVSSSSSSVSSLLSNETTSTDLSSTESTPVLKSISEQYQKTIFVEALVDSAILIIDIIWPVNVCQLQGITNTHNNQRKKMPLRRFIQETLKRSRTSYSTFQVALYYLILVKQSEKRYKMTCGRRAFLTALILASKYLQDKSYSLTAWSKISGLSVKELFKNEMEFLDIVNYKLHIEHEIYGRWSTLLLSSASQDGLVWSERVKRIGIDLCEQVKVGELWDFIDFNNDDTMNNNNDNNNYNSPAVTHEDVYMNMNMNNYRNSKSTSNNNVTNIQLATPAMSDNGLKREFDDISSISSDDEFGVCGYDYEQQQSQEEDYNRKSKCKRVF